MSEAEAIIADTERIIGAPFPEHTKLAKVRDQSQSAGEFVTWLRETKHAHLMVWQEWDEDEPCPDHMGMVRRRAAGRVCMRCGGPEDEPGTVPAHYETWMPLRGTITDLLAEFFEIDQDRLEAEKEAMLDAQRALKEAAE